MIWLAGIGAARITGQSIQSAAIEMNGCVLAAGRTGLDKVLHAKRAAIEIERVVIRHAASGKVQLKLPLIVSDPLPARVREEPVTPSELLPNTKDPAVTLALPGWSKN